MILWNRTKLDIIHRAMVAKCPESSEYLYKVVKLG